MTEPDQILGSDLRVSVIMNCLNCSRYLREAIDSVYAQTFENWEIVFWDNASSDTSADIAQSYDDGRLRYFRGDNTVSLGEARNLALAQARGDFIAFQDCDDVWLPYKLEQQLPLFEREEVGLVFSDCVNFDVRGVEHRNFRGQKPPRGRVFRHLLTDYFLPLSTVMVRRSVLDTLDELFDPRFTIMEEADLFQRVVHKCEVDYVGEPLARYRIHASNLSRTGLHLHAAEWDLFIDRLCEKYPGFEEDYATEIVSMRRVAQYKRALAEWENGQAKAARRSLRESPPSLRSALIYVLTFFPFKVYDLLVNFRRKLRTIY